MPRLSIARIWHPYWNWEDYHAGMWRKLPKYDERKAFAEALEFTGDHKLYGSWMRRVVDEWPAACEHNFTDSATNKQAWVGHAACALALGLPEYIVRKAWALLSDEQRVAANKEADEAYAVWLDRYRQENLNDGQLCFDFEGQNPQV